jgi:hypothetical protein
MAVELLELYLWDMMGGIMRRVEASKGEDKYIGAEGQATVGRSTRKSPR